MEILLKTLHCLCSKCKGTQIPWKISLASNHFMFVFFGVSYQSLFAQVVKIVQLLKIFCGVIYLATTKKYNRRSGLHVNLIDRGPYISFWEKYNPGGGGGGDGFPQYLSQKNLSVVFQECSRQNR